MPGNVLGGDTDLFVFRVGGHYHHLERGDGRRQPEAVFVVTLLDGRRQNTLDPNPVAAHDRRDLLAIPVEHARAHGFGILVAQLEDVTDLDCGIDAQRSATIGARTIFVRAIFACGHAAQIDVSRRMKSFPRRQVLDVIVLFVGAADQVGAAFERLIDEQDGFGRIFHVASPVGA